MTKPMFGPAGNPKSFYDSGKKHSYEMPGFINSMGLDWYEYSSGKGIRIKEDTAVQIGEEAKKHAVQMSVHAPYYINFANDDAQKRQRSQEYVYQTLEVAKYMQAKRVVLHTGSAKGKNRRTAMETVVAEMKKAVAEKNNRGFGDIALCPETLGKINQIGSLDEILEICDISEELIPTIDFGHLHSRSNGSIKTQADYAAILDHIENALGKERLDIIHIHFSHQEYTENGEKRHLTFEDTVYGPFFEPLSREIVKRKMNPVVVCESKDAMVKDAVAMKKMYEQDLLCFGAVL